MVREPDATRQTTPHDIQLMSKHRVLSFKPQLRLERRGQDGQSETEQPDHSASLGDSFTASTRMRFSVHTADFYDLSVGMQLVETDGDFFEQNALDAGGPALSWIDRHWHRQRSR
jgi:hypothetical protein